MNSSSLTHTLKELGKQYLHTKAEMLIWMCFCPITIFCTDKSLNLFNTYGRPDRLQKNSVNSALPETTQSAEGLAGKHTKILLPV